MPYTDERKTTRFVDFAFGIPRKHQGFSRNRHRTVRGAEDFVCWGQWSFRRSDFVSASTRTETTRIHPIFRLALSFWLKIWFPSWIFIISRKNICVLPGIPRIFSKGRFLLRRKGRNKSQTAFLRSDFEVGPEQMLGNMVAELRFGWLEIAMFQTTLTFWNLYEALKFTQNIWWTPGKRQPMWQVNFWSFEFFHFSRCMTGRVDAGLGKSLVIVRALVRRKERCLVAASKLVVVPIFFLLKFNMATWARHL